jgi:glycosyltransferase involved in cell wall biosynthesis
MNNQKLVSIAIATYNGEKFLTEQLDSIYNQTYKNIEVVVCDDCSADNTVEILEEYKQRYGLKYFVNEKNLGYIKNFEKVISLCSGEYIAFSDQDDIWLSEKIEILFNEISNYSLIHTNAELIDEKGNSLNNTLYSRLFKELGLKPAILLNDFDKKESVQGCTCMFSKEVLKKAVPFKLTTKFAHDYWIALVSSKMNGIKYVDKCLVKYRLHENNAVGINKCSKRIKRLKFYEKHFPFLYSIAKYFKKVINHLLIEITYKQIGL